MESRLMSSTGKNSMGIRNCFGYVGFGGEIGVGGGGEF